MTESTIPFLDAMKSYGSSLLPLRALYVLYNKLDFTDSLLLPLYRYTGTVLRDLKGVSRRRLSHY